MAERIPNHVCKICGKKYYACDGCRKYNSYKRDCCSIECYDKYVQRAIDARASKVEPIKEVESVFVEYKSEEEQIVDEYEDED